MTDKEFKVSESGKKYLPGRIVSPEIEQMNEERRFADKKTIFQKVMNRDGRVEVDLPDDKNVEQALIDDPGTYKLGTGPHHVTQVNKPPRLELKPRDAKVRAFIPDGVLFKIPNVHQYFMEHGEEHGWYDPESFSCVKMPFDRITFSYDHDFKNVDTGVILRRHVNLVMEKATVDSFFEFLKNRAMLSEADVRELAHIIDRKQPDSMIRSHMAFDAISAPGVWYLMLDETGHILTDKMHDQLWLWIRDPWQDAQLQEIKKKISEQDADSFGRHGMICCAALQFLNCKNVEVLDNPPTRQQRRQAEREGKKPEVTYKTLVIHPMGKKRQVTRQADGSVRPGVSLHIVRGHFKNYTAGAGLGRAHVHGVYWWSPNLRGSAERGRIEKDYAVETE
jgi:hypothetical protein